MPYLFHKRDLQKKSMKGVEISMVSICRLRGVNVAINNDHITCLGKMVIASFGFDTLYSASRLKGSPGFVPRK